MNMDASTMAAAFALALAAYLLITDWVDLAPWNKVDDLPVRQKLLISVANYTPLLFVAVAVLLGGGVLGVLAVLVGVVDLAMHVAYWWLPYLRGASAEQLTERKQLFGGTTTFLPAIGNHPIPNAQHVIVGILMTAMVAFTAVSAI
jgi:hypothetical protein